MLWGCFLSVLIFSACGKEPVHQDLTERDANEILVALYKQGIDATKLRVQSAQEVTYVVEVPKDKIHQARQVLADSNLPRKKQLGFSGICEEKGLIPTPAEEKCRKLLALKGEIINSLERVPGVIDADVVLNIPEISEFADDTAASKKPTASAVIRVKKDEAGAEVSESRLQRFISNGVENLDPRDVSVIVSYVEPPQKVIEKGPQTGAVTAGAPPGAKLAKIAGLILSEVSVKRFKIYAVAMLVVLIGVSAALILNVIKMTKMRQELKVFRAQAGMGSEAPATPLLEEGSQSKQAQLKSGKEETASSPSSTRV